MMSDDYDCDDVRDALAAYVAGSLPGEQARRVERHLAQCARCADEAQQWRALGALAHAYPVSAPTPPFADAWAQLQPRLASAASEGAASVVSATWELRLREVQLDDITSAPPAPAGALRALKPMRRSGPMRHTRTFAAVAAALALVIISASVFAALIRERQDAHSGSPATTTTCAPGQISARLPQNAQLADLAMTSPTDGWAVGNTISMNSMDEPLLMRYHDCRWAPVATPALNGLDNVALNSISMDSATDGWATGYPVSGETSTSEILLRDVRGQWQRVTVPGILPGYNWFTKVVAVTPGDVWFLVNTRSTNFQFKWTNMLLHFSDGRWTAVAPPFPFIGDMTVVGSDNIFISGAQDQFAHQSTLGHYQHGAWTVTSVAGVQMGALRMLSPTDGWDVASIPSPNNMENEATLVPLHFVGATWSRANLGIPAGAYAMSVISDTDMWAFNGGMSYHYTHGRWTMAALPQDPANLSARTEGTVQSTSSVSPLVRTSDGAYWTIANYPGGATNNESISESVLMRFADGAWTE